MRLPGIGQRRSHAEGHLEGEADLPGDEIAVVARLGIQAGGALHVGDDRVEGLQGRAGHDGLGAVEVLAQTVQLIEGLQAQLRQQLVAGDQELELGHADEDLLLDDVGLEVEHLGEAGIPVGLEACLGRRRDGDDAPVVGGGKAEDVSELSFGGDHVGGAGDQVEIELFESLGGFGDVGDGAAADDELGLLAIQDFLGQADGPIGGPELNVGLGEVPVLLLDRANVGHDFGLEPPDGGIGVQALDHDRGAVGLQADRPGGGLVGQGCASQEGLSQGELKVGGVGRGPDQERAVLVGPGDVVDDAELRTGFGLFRETRSAR